MKVEITINSIWKFDKKRDQARVETTKDGTQLLVIGNKRFLPVLELMEEDAKNTECYSGLDEDVWDDAFDHMQTEDTQLRVLG